MSDSRPVAQSTSTRSTSTQSASTQATSTQATSTQATSTQATSTQATSTQATSTTIGTWEADNVSIGHVERALSDLRRHEQRAAVRASVLTLVAVTQSQAEADLVRGIVHDLGVRHPSRTLVVVLEKGAPDLPAGEGTGVDASLWVHANEYDGRVVCFEEVRLLVRGPARFHLDSIVGPFALPDVPLVVWLPASLPSPGDPLLDVADRLVVDSRAADEGGGDVLARAAVLARRIPVTDLSWIRMAPWRSLLAGLFEGSVNRPFLDGIDRVEVAGNRGPRQLLGGWLLRRLGLPAARVELKSAPHLSVCIHSTDLHGKRGSFCVMRTGAERVITSTVDIEDGPHLEQLLRMQERWPALALAGALTNVGHDEPYEEALAGARELRGAA